MKHKGLKPVLSSLALGSALMLAAPSGAEAAVIINITQSGSDVVAVGSGSLNLAELTFFSNGSGFALIFASGPVIRIGPVSSVPLQIYSGVVSPDPFGTGDPFSPSSGNGDLFGAYSGGIFLPSGYVSGNPLSGTSTYAGQTFATLGLTPGDYAFTWGSGPTADSLTVRIGAVPEPSAALLGLLAAPALLLRRRR